MVRGTLAALVVLAVVVVGTYAVRYYTADVRGRVAANTKTLEILVRGWGPERPRSGGFWRWGRGG